MKFAGILLLLIISSKILSAQTYNRDTSQINLFLQKASKLIRKNPDSAFLYAKKVLFLANQIQAEEKVSAASELLGYLEKNKGNFSSALDYYVLAQDFFEKHKKEADLMRLYNRIGTVHLQITSYDKALSFFLKSLLLADKLNETRQRADIFTNIGNVYWYQNDLKAALSYYEEALRIQLSLKDSLGIAAAYNNLGIVFQKQKKSNDALHYFNQALTIYQKIQLLQGAATTLNNIAVIYAEQKSHQKALSIYDSTKKLYEKIDYSPGIATSLNEMGYLYFLLKSYEQAQKLAKQALELGQKNEDKRILMNAYLTLYKIDSAQNNFKDAFIHYQKHKILEDSLQSNAKARQILEIQAKYELGKKESENKILRTEKENQTLRFNRQRIIGIATILFLTFLLLGLYFWYRFRQIIRTERLRTQLASDLHDEIGSQMTRIALQAELLQYNQDKEKSQISLQNIASLSRQAIQSMSDVVWSVDARKDKFGDLLARMQEHLFQMLHPLDIPFEVRVYQISEDLKLKMDFRQNVYLIFKEAIHNIAKHSDTPKVEIHLSKTKQTFEMSIQDFGKPKKQIITSSGLGIQNMQMRAKRIGGILKIEKEEGYHIKLKVDFFTNNHGCTLIFRSAEDNLLKLSSFKSIKLNE